MKNLLKKLHIMSNQSEDSSDGPSSSRNNRLTDASLTERLPQSNPENNNKPLSAISGWLNSVTNRKSPSPPSSSNFKKVEQSDSPTALDPPAMDSGSNNTRDPDIEEEYQIQLAIELSAREDPEAAQIEAVKQFSLGSCSSENTLAEVLAYRYWNYNALGYDEKVLDGFYDVYGVLTELNSSSSKMPSLVDLQVAPISDSISWEAVLVNRAGDANLVKLEGEAMELISLSRLEDSNNFGDLARKLAVFVSDYMGGPVGDPANLLRAWRDLSYNLKVTIGSMVLPLGSVTIGLARHRALLFKVLADNVGIPCRLVKGQQYTGSDDVAMNFIKTDDGREYIVDLMADPGTLIPSDAAGSHIEYEESILDSSAAASSTSFEEHSDKRSSDFTNSTVAGNESDIQSDKRRNIHPFDIKKDFTRGTHMHARSPSWTEGVSSPAVRRMKFKDVSQYMIDAAKENPQLAQKLHDVLLESGVVAPPNLFTEMYSEEIGLSVAESKSPPEIQKPRFLPPLPPPGRHSLEVTPARLENNVPIAAAAAAAAAAVVASSMVVVTAKTGGPDLSVELPMAAAATATAAAAAVVTAAMESRPIEFSRSDDNERTSDRSAGNDSAKSDVTLDDVADCEIPWEDISLGERIGLGSYGEVYRGELHGTEVAVKKFLDQDISGESLEEFRSEVYIMKRLRHPNVVLFMGAVTRAPNLSIITEFLPRGSLYRLIHRPNNQLDERRRLRMALDAARGMNYLHTSTPVIVHRDLKSPNLLVDKNWVLKVCDFGLSKMKHSTFLSSRSTAGTAEWMAPEVLRNEPSNEKCDVFSFGVILWELCTMRQPWGGMNPMQVVGAVGFQHRRLDIPDDTDPAIADIIRKCWQTDPKLRPSFSEIMAALKPLQKPLTAQGSRPNMKTNNG
ncbi:probable serine/threonine-protein kinase SIS8 [Impatiens glandulifera]|uniref:probable serine/threonine-protein kinase SIS8 n=1 Tax=Impatiens glandulifera TaxID=253017 RepID=UPI001FB0F173|nr:probable serine/threonine-protein kinase SIS8 [Impatiens glandulifera]